MSIELSTPNVDALSSAVHAMRAWQVDGASVPLHPGDLGWHWRFGAEATAAAVRTWSRDGQLLAIGLLDGADLLRLAVAPLAQHDEQLAHQVHADASRTDRGVLPPGAASVEARFGGPLRDIFVADGWDIADPWTPLQRDLSQPVADCGLRIEVTDAQRADVRVSLQRAAFANSTFTVDRWRTMAAGPAYADAECLVGYDDQNVAVAAVTVWSAGVGRPGLIEPMGVDSDHRGSGYGTAITIAAAAALRRLGSSSATVCTASSNVGGVATYRAAGFEPLAEVGDLRRSAQS
jgi:ribosomal protein S18 acetylase RimI-like enzyme